MYYRVNSTFVNQVMSKNVLTLDKSTSLQEAAENMKKLNVGCVIVTGNNNPIGIITERDRNHNRERFCDKNSC
jgi:predicted transcriptional regulator